MFVIGGVFGLGAVILFVVGFVSKNARHHHTVLAARLKALEVIPSTPAAARNDEVVFHGSVEVDEPATEPVFQQPCAWYTSTVFDRSWRPKARRYKYHTRHKHQGHASFWLRDHKGRVFIESDDLRVEKAPLDESQDWVPKETPEQFKSALKRLGVNPDRWSLRGRKVGYQRQVLKAGDLVYVYGGVEVQVPKEAYRSVATYKVVPIAGLPVRVSTHSPDEGASRQKDLAASTVTSSVIMFVLASVFLLVGIGLILGGAL